VLSGEVEDLLLLDVTHCRSASRRGRRDDDAHRSLTIPTRRSEIFSTAADNQTNVEVHVLQGERPLA
jgi:molecular chaperone DnaK